MKKFVSTYKNPLLLALLLFVAGRGFSLQTSLFSNGSSGALTVSGTQVINSYYGVSVKSWGDI